jgi:putative flippase GtrA
VIPAYRPDQRLVSVASGIRSALGAPILVVDDGSGPAHAQVFAEAGAVPGVSVVRHPENRGKGAALRSGFAAALRRYPQLRGVITADADGQHDPSDVAAVARAFEERPDALVLGVRGFEGRVPLRSRVGNRLGAWAYRALVGGRLSDTQTGLRGIPAELLRKLGTAGSSGYEFELDALIAARQHGIRVIENGIRTIYDARGDSSHFAPLRDSLRIAFALLRLALVALGTALLDNAVFLAAFSALGLVAPAQIAARLAAAPLNFRAARHAVFQSGEPHREALARYALLVAASGAVSYGLIVGLVAYLGLDVLAAKLAAESVLFPLNFLAQRDWVFRQCSSDSSTDWNAYHDSPAPAARLTRRFTAAALARMLGRALAGVRSPEIVEIGGGGGSMLEAVSRCCRPACYHVIDSNLRGLEQVQSRARPECSVRTHHSDIRSFAGRVAADAVFSIGLVEHFDPSGTRAVVRAHFELLREGGHAVISFPTPTLLYRVVRWIAELLGVWRFHDERPLSRAEVIAAVGERGRLVDERVIWSIVLTQRMMMFERVTP